MGNSFQAPGPESLLVDSKTDLMDSMYPDPSTMFPLDTLNGLANPSSSYVQADAHSSLQGVAISSKPQHTATNKLSLEKYREKQAAELLQRRKHGHLLPEPAALPSSSSLSTVLMSSSSSSSSSSLPRVKYGQPGQERETKSGSVKRRHPSSSSSSTENGTASQEELKMKIKMSESGGKSRHSPRSGREKHRASKHDTTHSHTHTHTHGHAHSSHHKAHRSSKSHAGSAPQLPAPCPTQLGKIDRRPGEGPSSESAAPLLLNGQHVDYADTFNMLDSLLNAHNMNY